MVQSGGAMHGRPRPTRHKKTFTGALSLIPDGIHLPPFVLRNFLRVKGIGKTLFTTDCMADAGMGPGSYRLLDLQLDVGPDGIVGICGRASHLKAVCDAIQCIRIHAVCDLSSEGLAEAAKSCGASGQYLHFDDMLESSELDAVIVGNTAANGGWVYIAK